MEKSFPMYQSDGIITGITEMVILEAGFILAIFILSGPSYFSACNSKTTVWRGDCLV